MEIEKARQDGVTPAEEKVVAGNTEVSGAVSEVHVQVQRVGSEIVTDDAGRITSGITSNGSYYCGGRFYASLYDMLNNINSTS